MIPNCTKKLLASTGLEALKHAVLLVLYEDHDYLRAVNKGQKQDSIRKELGIERIDEDDQARHNALIYGILSYLSDDGYVRHIGQRWKITDKGVTFIEG